MQCQNKPADYLPGVLRGHELQGGLVRSYGWRAIDRNTSWQREMPEAIIGFVKQR